MNQRAKNYIRYNTLNLESSNRMDSTGYVQYAVSEAKAYGAVMMAEEDMKQKAIKAFEAVCQSDNLKKCMERLGFESVMPCCDCMKRAYFIGSLNRIEELSPAILHITRIAELSEESVKQINEMVGRAYESKW